MRKLSNYIISPDGKLYHAKDHKYIKREWKKGRWNYTYPDDKDTSKKLSQTPSEKVVKTKRISDLTDTQKKTIDDEYQKNLESNSRKNVYPKQQQEQKNTEPAKKTTKTADELMTDLRDTHREARISAGTETWGAFEIDRGLADDDLRRKFAEEDLTSMINSLNEINVDELPRDKRKEAKAIIEDADKILSEWKRIYPDSSVTKAITDRQKMVSENASVGDKIKDKLGFDELDRYKLSSRNLELAKIRLEEAQHRVGVLNSQENKEYWTTKGKNIVNYYSDMYNDATAEVREATKNKNEAKSASDKTVAGAVYNAVESGKDFVENLFKKKKR